MKPNEFLKLWESTDGEGSDDYIILENGNWISNGKYQFKETVCQHTHNGKFFLVSQERSGSYYSDYEYDEPSCHEVVPKVITQTIYEVKND